MQVARLNNLTIRPSDLHDAEPLLFRLQPHAGVNRVKNGWLIAPGGGVDEAVFGPYAARPAGHYRVLVGFEPETSLPCPDVIRSIRVQINVTVDARTRELAPRRVVTLKPSTLASGQCMMSGEIDFSTSTPVTKIETPIWVQSAELPVRLTRYSLQRADGN